MSQTPSPRLDTEGDVPLLDVEGSIEQCGEQLGYAWSEVFQLRAERRGDDVRPWWQQRRFEPLIDRHAPYLPELFKAMARGASLPDTAIGAPALNQPAVGCTSFAIQPEAALEGQPISGQTKDTPLSRQYRYRVLRLKPREAHPVLTLTYPGELFGQGFARGGCAVFRNALNAGAGGGELPYMAWGILAQRCETVDEVVAMTHEYGVREGFHCTVADEHGNIVGIEVGSGGVGLLQPEGGLYAHANATTSGNLQRQDNDLGDYEEDSRHREQRLRDLFEREHGRLTAQLAHRAMGDHEHHPQSICRHQSKTALTTAAVVAEPTRGLLHVTRGAPCRNWPRTYRL